MLTCPDGKQSRMVETHDVYVDWLERENKAFLVAARHGLETPVPSCPGWSVGDLVVHHATFQRWATALIRDRAQQPTAPQAATPPSGIDVLSWYESIGAAFVAELRTTEPDTPVWCPSGGVVGAWARRQASETAVHRWDAQNAFGPAQPIDHADDYIGEMLGLLLPNLIAEFGAVAPVGTLALRPTDRDLMWVARSLTTGIQISTDGAADVTVSGPTSDLFLTIWNRPSSANVDGYVRVLNQWRAAISGS